MTKLGEDYSLKMLVIIPFKTLRPLLISKSAINQNTQNTNFATYLLEKAA